MSQTSAIEIQDFALWDKMKSKRSLFSFDLELTARCNNDCRHCYINLPANDKAAQERELTLATKLPDIADQAMELGALWCLITGGEPLLRHDFADIYLMLKRKGLLVSVFTNATAIRAEHIALFKKYPPRDIEVTVYGARTRPTKRSRGGPARIRRLCAGWIACSRPACACGSKPWRSARICTRWKRSPRLVARRTKDFYRFDPQLHLRFDGDPVRNAEIRQERLTPEEIVALERADEGRFRRAAKRLRTH